MSRIILVVFVLMLLVLACGTLVLGMFPPGPKTEQVLHVLPNDKFQSR